MAGSEKRGLHRWCLVDHQTGPAPMVLETSSMVCGDCAKYTTVAQRKE